MPIKQVFIDIESTGTDAKIHGIRQIAGIIKVDGVFVDSFDIKMAPFPNDQIDRNAMISLGVDVDQISKEQDPLAAYAELISKLSVHIEKYDRKDKAYLLGYNVRFDEEFLRQWFLKCGDKYFGSWFWTPAIDIMTLAAAYTMIQNHRPKMENFKLDTVCQHFGVELSNAHDAMADIGATVALYERLYQGTILFTEAQ